MKSKTAIKLAGGPKKLGLYFTPPITRQAVQRWGKDMPPLRDYQLREIVPEWFDPVWLAAHPLPKKTRRA